MFKSSLLIVPMLGCGLLAGALCWQSSAKANAGPADISELVAGCYTADCTISPQVLGPDVPPQHTFDWIRKDYRMLFTLSPDGAIMSSASQDFGDTDDHLFGPVHGAWVQSSARGLTFVRVGFGFGLDGEHVLTWKSNGDLEFNGDLSGGFAEYVICAYRPDQDPFDPDEEPYRIYDGEMKFTRFGH